LTWLVAPTSTGRRAASFRPEIEIDGTMTRVMVEQLTVIDPQTRLGVADPRLQRQASPDALFERREVAVGGSAIATIS